jgi:hypothetical protein
MVSTPDPARTGVRKLFCGSPSVQEISCRQHSSLRHLVALDGVLDPTNRVLSAFHDRQGPLVSVLGDEKDKGTFLLM